MKEAHSKIPKLAQGYWENEEYDKVQEVMTMAAPFKTSDKKHASFEETLKNCSSHPPEDCVVSTEPDRNDMEEEELIQARLRLNKMLTSRDSKGLVSMQPKMLQYMQKKADCFAPNTLKDAMVLLMSSREELAALDWAIKMSQMFSKAEKYELFVPIAQLLLRPTIYDSQQDVEAALNSGATNDYSSTNKKGFSSAASVYSETPAEDNMSSKASSTNLTVNDNKNASPLHRRAQ
ncbi:hypothetical protein RFI_15214, partial [Reticulomyxa filosa]